MVGNPKHLSDLAKIEADVRVTCRRCRFEEDWTREALAHHIRDIGGSLVWSEITRHMHCRRHGCGSGDLRILPVPYARRPANMPRRIGKLDDRLITAALSILDETVRNERGQGVATPPVHLALLVVHVYARDADAVRLFWERAGRTSRGVNNGLGEPLAKLKWHLEQRGWTAPKTLLEPCRVWPWQSPAPPGWLAPAHNPRPAANDGEGEGSLAP